MRRNISDLTVAKIFHKKLSQSLVIFIEIFKICIALIYSIINHITGVENEHDNFFLFS